MNALFRLSVANLKSFIRDRAALFWTIAFPLIFVVVFGLDLHRKSGPDLVSGSPISTAPPPRPR